MDAKDALLSKTRQRVLSELFAPASREGLSYAELLRRTAGGSGAVHRELTRLLAAGLIVQRRTGGQRLFSCNTRHPAFRALQALVEELLLRGPDRRRDSSELGPPVTRAFAKKYIWWKRPDEAASDPRRLAAQVMNLGTLADTRVLIEQLGRERLRDVLVHARAGEFDERSWNYWHYRLGLSRPGLVPALPQRRFA